MVALRALAAGTMADAANARAAKTLQARPAHPALPRPAPRRLVQNCPSPCHSAFFRSCSALPSVPLCHSYLRLTFR